MGVGFIRDKLEIKFLILYVTAGVAEPMPLSDIQALTMIDDGIDYFDFSQCLNELVKTGHLRINDEQKYAIASGDGQTGFCQREKIVVVHIDVSVFAESLHGNTDAWLGVTKMSGYIDGTHF